VRRRIPGGAVGCVSFSPASREKKRKKKEEGRGPDRGAVSFSAPVGLPLGGKKKERGGEKKKTLPAISYRDIVLGAGFKKRKKGKKMPLLFCFQREGKRKKEEKKRTSLPTAQAAEYLRN